MSRRPLWFIIWDLLICGNSVNTSRWSDVTANLDWNVLSFFTSKLFSGSEAAIMSSANILSCVYCYCSVQILPWYSEAVMVGSHCVLQNWQSIWRIENLIWTTLHWKKSTKSLITLLLQWTVGLHYLLPYVQGGQVHPGTGRFTFSRMIFRLHWAHLTWPWYAGGQLGLRCEQPPGNNDKSSSSADPKHTRHTLNSNCDTTNCIYVKYIWKYLAATLYNKGSLVNINECISKH